jgi:hypothetical protein
MVKRSNQIRHVYLTTNESSFDRWPNQTMCVRPYPKPTIKILIKSMHQIAIEYFIHLILNKFFLTIGKYPSHPCYICLLFLPPGFSQRMNSLIIHDNIFSLIYKRCHPKSYAGDIKYHMTLNVIFSVVTF